MLYAYPREKGEISIETWAEENKIFLAVKDRGIPFDPTTIKMPSIKEIITNAGRGGLGIFLAQKLMNGFHYRREDDQNILTLSRIIRKA
jgi:anti-sigma regulatory factor (Ser/Thr protein kinase)